MLGRAIVRSLQANNSKSDPKMAKESTPNVVVTPTSEDDSKDVADDAPRIRRHSGRQLGHLSPAEQRETLQMRHRSGSFNPTMLNNTSTSRAIISQADKSLLYRERSYTDIHQPNHQVRSFATLPRQLRRPSVINGSTASSLDSGDTESFDSFESESELEEVQCLLTTGLILDVNVHPDDEMGFIKQIVLSTATNDERLPLRGCLTPDAECYLLTYVSQQGRREEVLDETKTLRELKPFKNILKFAKRSKDQNQYQFKKNVGRLIGKDLKEFDNMRNCEVNDFRWRMKVFANTLAQERRAKLKESWRHRIMYQYPPRLVLNPMDKPVKHLLRVDLTWDSHQETHVPADISAEDLVMKLGKKYNYDDAYSATCCIKTIGEESYLLGGHRLIDYAYIYDSPLPKLVVMNVDSIEIEKASDKVYISLENDVLDTGLSSSSPMQSKDSKKCSLTPMSISTWAAISPFQSTLASTNVERKFAVKIDSIRLPVECSGLLGIQLGLFHGGRPLCAKQCHFAKGPADENGLHIVDQVVELDMKIRDLPRMTKLCVGLFEKKKTQAVPLYWVNANVFDYTAKIRRHDTLRMWKYSLGDVMPTHEHLSPLRNCISNLDNRDTAHLVLCMDCSGDDEMRVQFPDVFSIEKKMSGFAFEVTGNGSNGSPRGTISKLYTPELVKIAGMDPLHDLTVQEKDLIWKVREHCLLHLPNLLPRIIDCVDYANPSQVAELHNLISRWPLLSSDDALLLLDYAYPDEHVRNYAVRCLRKSCDDVILCYLLQLAQALKHESYLHCDLVEFLLERALNNQHIGHNLFWELKAEMNSPSVGLQYGLILEAYLVAAPEHLRILEHQMALLEKCRATHTSIQKVEATSRSYDKAVQRFSSSTRSQFKGSHPYRNFINPLNPSQKCRKIYLEKCRLMNSKKRPQMLYCENVDSHLSGDLEEIVIMFKKGDDLRQDRLTLQLLTVMDRLWKQDAGLDLRLNVYRCVSTDAGEGFIEVVRNAETVCKIQMRQAAADKLILKTTAALRKGLVLSWLRNHNSQPEHMRKAQKEFTLSCAGYSVATYILGIADRHNDNIMVRTNGQLFHIDFGHFLGNFKHKFGIRRERVPMVLPSEFVEVIKEDLGSPKNFEVFRDLCERAFLTIRRRGSLIISLLSMMISTGLPELSSELDLHVVRTTLHLDQASEEVALECFRKDFNESLRNSWTISLNWWVHMMNQVRSKGVK